MLFVSLGRWWLTGWIPIMSANRCVDVARGVWICWVRGMGIACWCFEK